MNEAPLSLPKLYRHGTHRAIEPGETLERLRPWLPSFGITRVADITGLDTIGLPVAVAVRPGSRSNITFQGKGMEREAAKVSAVMEAIETFYAERMDGPVLWASALEMHEAGRSLIPWERLTAREGTCLSAQTRLLWFEGRQLAHGTACWLPFECVHTNFTLPAPAGSGHCVASTNGLASGNDRREALVHGLCEVIERDAQILFSQDPQSLDSRRLDLASVDDPDAAEVIAQIADRGFVVAVWDITSDIGIASFKCHIMERQSGPGLMPLPAEGHGCHPDRGIALLRAVLEAVQSRATIIAGSRDDVGPSLYARFDDMAELARWRERLGSTECARTFGRVPHTFHETIDEDLDLVMRQLQHAGLHDIIAVDLRSDNAAPISIVRVVVPGLEGPPGQDIVLGSRARTWREQHQ
jgi:YcaO-like protein with predicted kinase domain